MTNYCYQKHDQLLQINNTSLSLQGHEQHNRSPATPSSAARPPFQGPSPWHPATPRPPPSHSGLPPPGTPGTPTQRWKPASSPAPHRDSAGVPVYIRVNKRITASKAIDVSTFIVDCNLGVHFSPAGKVSQPVMHILEHTCVQLQSLNTDPSLAYACDVNLKGPQTSI